MPDARATFRAWLTEVHGHTECPHAYHPCADCLTDAILTAPGVQVEEKPLFDAEDWESPKPTHTQVVIRLPAQPIQETP